MPTNRSILHDDQVSRPDNTDHFVSLVVADLGSAGRVGVGRLAPL